MRNWAIRRAGPDDASALAACIEAAYAVYAGRVADLPPVSEGIAEDIRDNLVWVATSDAAVVAGIVLVRHADHLVLANVAVAPDMAGAGLGRALLQLAETEARALGVAELRLATHVDIPENLALYTHLGWRETGRVGNKVLMAKGLADP